MTALQEIVYGTSEQPMTWEIKLYGWFALAFICTFSGWANNVYAVQPEDIFSVLSETLKPSAVFGAVMAFGLVWIKAPSQLTRFITVVGAFMVFTLISPVTAYVGWMVWRWILFFTN